MTFFSRFRILRFVAVRAWREPVLIFIKRNLFPAIFAFVLAFPGVSPVCGIGHAPFVSCCHLNTRAKKFLNIGCHTRAKPPVRYRASSKRPATGFPPSHNPTGCLESCNRTQNLAICHLGSAFNCLPESCDRRQNTPPRNVRSGVPD
mgnify:CR=1 FL=1